MAVIRVDRLPPSLASSAPCGSASAPSNGRRENAPRPVSLSPKRYETHLASGRFHQSDAKHTSPWVTFIKVMRNAPRPGSLSSKRCETHLAPGHFHQSDAKRTSPRVTFIKAMRNAPRPGSLSSKQRETHLAPGHFHQSDAKWTSPRVAFTKAMRNGPRPGSLSSKTLCSSRGFRRNALLDLCLDPECTSSTHTNGGGVCGETFYR